MTDFPTFATGARSNLGNACFVRARLDFLVILRGLLLIFSILPVHCDCAPLERDLRQGGVASRTPSVVL